MLLVRRRTLRGLAEIMMDGHPIPFDTEWQTTGPEPRLIAAAIRQQSKLAWSNKGGLFAMWKWTSKENNIMAEDKKNNIK